MSGARKKAAKKKTAKKKRQPAREPVDSGDRAARAALAERFAAARRGELGSEILAAEAGVVPRRPWGLPTCAGPGPRSAQVTGERTHPIEGGIRAVTPGVILVHDDKHYHGLDRVTLEPLWSERFKESTALDPTSFAAPFGDEVVLGDVRVGVLERRDARSGELLARRTLPEKLGQCALAGDRLIVLDKKGKALSALELLGELGAELWTRKANKPYAIEAAHRHLQVESTFHRVEDGEPLGKPGGRLLDLDDARGACLLSAGGSASEAPLGGEPTWCWAGPEGTNMQEGELGGPWALLLHTVKTVDEVRNEDGFLVSTSVDVAFFLRAVSRTTGESPFALAIEAERRTARWTAAVYDDLIVLAASGPRRWTLRAFEANTGEELWSHALPTNGGRPLLFPRVDGLEVIQHLPRRQNEEGGPILEPALHRLVLVP